LRWKNKWNTHFIFLNNQFQFLENKINGANNEIKITEDVTDTKEKNYWSNSGIVNSQKLILALFDQWTSSPTSLATLSIHSLSWWNSLLMELWANFFIYPISFLLCFQWKRTTKHDDNETFKWRWRTIRFNFSVWINCYAQVFVISFLFLFFFYDFLRFMCALNSSN